MIDVRSSVEAAVQQGKSREIEDNEVEEVDD